MKKVFVETTEAEREETRLAEHRQPRFRPATDAEVLAQPCVVEALRKARLQVYDDIATAMRTVAANHDAKVGPEVTQDDRTYHSDCAWAYSRAGKYVEVLKRQAEKT